MSARGTYHTKNHDLLISILRANSDKCFSVDDVCRMMSAQGSRADRTTVYRQLEKLAARGMAHRQSTERGDGVVYRFCGEECGSHLHLRCLDCGRIIHLDCRFAESFSEHLYADHAFTVDNGLTVIYGHCGCASRENAEAGR